jgi:ABC-type glycerol-3-phosphate transport system substrate-binding protein
MKISVKKIIALICAVTCVTSILSSCGKKQEGSGKIKITLWNKPTQDAKQLEIDNYNEMMEMLAKEFPDVEFETQIPPQGTDYRQEYDKALMANKAPSIYNKFSYTDVITRSQDGTIADITNLVNNWDLRKEGKILTTFDEAICVNNKWYAIPFKGYTQATMVNLKTLKEAGVDTAKLPATWKEFGELGAKVTDLSIPRVGYSLVGMDWCAWPFTAWIWSAGGEMVRSNDDGTYKIAFNEDEGIDTAMFMNEMIWKYKMTQKDVLMGYDDLKKNIRNGTSCFAWASFSDLSVDDMEQYGLKPSDFTVMSMPVKDSSIKRPALSGGEVITFNPKLSQEELEVAFKVAEFMYLSDYAMEKKRKANEDGLGLDTYIPGRVDWYEKCLDAIETLSNDAKEALAAAVDGAKPEPYCPHWSDVKSQLAAPLQKIFLKEGITREEVKQILDDVADELYKLYPETFVK